MNKRILFLLLALTSHSVFACSAFVLKRQDFNLHALNMEWKFREGIFMVHPRNQVRTARLNDNNLRPLIWKSNYGSVVLHAGKIGKPGQAADGINEKGLVASALVLEDSIYDTTRPERPALNTGMWVQYILDKFSTVQEVIAESDNIIIVPEMFHDSSLKLHLMVSDTSGETIILEYLNGILSVIEPDDNKRKLITNDAYHWSLQQLEHYNRFGGEKETPGMSDSHSRFVRGSIRMHNLPGFIAKEDSVAYGFSMLGHLAQGPMDEYPTQVSQIFDIKNKRLYWRSANESAIRYLNLDELKFDKLTRERALSPYIHQAGNMLSHLKYV